LGGGEEVACGYGQDEGYYKLGGNWEARKVVGLEKLLFCVE
jgi:hypothetical protein